jgi:hypothetical protein
MFEILRGVGSGLCHTAAKHVHGVGPAHCSAPDSMEAVGLAFVLSAALAATLALVARAG